MFGNIDRVWSELSRSARFAALTVGVLVLWLGLLFPALENTPILEHVRGGTADWLVTREAIIGENSYASVSDLAEKHLGWIDAKPDAPHPRPPSALLILLPLAAVPPELTILAIAVASALALAFWAQCCVLWTQARPGYELLVIPFAVIKPVFQGVAWGSHVPLVAAAIGAAMTLSIAKDRPGVRGLFIGIAAGLKLFPIAIAFAFKHQRTAVLTGAGLSVVLMTILGLALPGASAEAAFNSIFDASTNFGASSFNMSVSHHLGGSVGISIAVIVLGLVGITAASSKGDQQRVIAASLVLMVLISPLAWPEYLVLALPAFLLLAVGGTASRLFALLAWTALVFTIDGTTLLLVSVALVVSMSAPMSDFERQRKVLDAA